MFDLFFPPFSSPSHLSSSSRKWFVPHWWDFKGYYRRPHCIYLACVCVCVCVVYLYYHNIIFFFALFTAQLLLPSPDDHVTWSCTRYNRGGEQPRAIFMSVERIVRVCTCVRHAIRSFPVPRFVNSNTCWWRSRKLGPMAVGEWRCGEPERLFVFLFRSFFSLGYEFFSLLRGEERLIEFRLRLNENFRLFFIEA